MQKAKIIILTLIIFVISFYLPISSVSQTNDNIDVYITYLTNYQNIKHEKDITKNGFKILETPPLIAKHKNLGELTVVAAIDNNCRRLVLFFINKNGYVVYKTDDLICNKWLKGQAVQPNFGVDCIYFCDLNGDRNDDIVVISRCKNDSGVYNFYTEKTYTVADALFQNDNGYYRDPRISDKINRFDMNKNHLAAAAFVRDGISTEFLYTAKTTGELFANGFKKTSNHFYTEYFEKFGVADFIPGYFTLEGQSCLMIYIADKNGRILWNFQPMHDYLNFYEIKSVSFCDIDRDGNKDILLIARFSTFDAYGNAVIVTDYNVYYQRSGYFVEDKKFKQAYKYTNGDNAEAIIEKIRKFKDLKYE